MTQDYLKKLQLIAAQVREKALTAIQAAGSGHVGGSLSVADILTVLYFDKMHVDPKHPQDPERDRFVLSKGHCTPAMYAVLALKGYFPVEELLAFRHIESTLSGHVEMTKVPGVDMSAGSLGQGLSAAVGMALSAQADQKGYRIYAVVGDGEIQEGQIWEAAMAAAHYKLDRLTVFVDNNNLQIDGTLDEVMSPYPIDEKFRAFGWNVQVVDGHDIKELSRAVDEARKSRGKPNVIIARTIKGKGISFMENQAEWHGKVPDEEQYRQAFTELRHRIAELEG